jgi:hypothetical protein
MQTADISYLESACPRCGLHPSCPIIFPDPACWLLDQQMEIPSWERGADARENSSFVLLVDPSSENHCSTCLKTLSHIPTVCSSNLDQISSISINHDSLMFVLSDIDSVSRTRNSLSHLFYRRMLFYRVKS